MIRKDRNDKELFLKILRVTKKLSYTEGVMFNENTNSFLYDILEDKIRDTNADGDLDDPGEKKVYGKTAIPFTPEGYYYELSIVYSPKFKQEVVLVNYVPDFTAIELHWGKTAEQSAGCVLGGKRIAPGILKNVGYTKAMVQLLKQYGGKGYLKIN